MGTRKPILAGTIALAVAATSLAGAGTAAAGGTRTLCVGDSAAAHATLQAALDRSHDGDTIVLGRGTFAGGVTVRTSVHIEGAGAWATIIRGGGPVMTIGVRTPRRSRRSPSAASPSRAASRTATASRRSAAASTSCLPPTRPAAPTC